MMMAAAKLATSATGPATKVVDDVIDDINKKKQSIRSEADEQLNIGAATRKTEITAKQRWNWAFNKIVLQLNVSTLFFDHYVHSHHLYIVNEGQTSLLIWFYLFYEIIQWTNINDSNRVKNLINLFKISHVEAILFLFCFASTSD